jgi:hypothetical protein
MKTDLWMWLTQDMYFCWMQHAGNISKNIGEERKLVVWWLKCIIFIWIIVNKFLVVVIKVIFYGGNFNEKKNNTYDIWGNHFNLVIDKKGVY